MQPEPITDPRALEIACGRDPFVRFDAALAPGETAYQHGSAVAVRRLPHFSQRPPTVCVIGASDQDAADLLAWIAREEPWGRPTAISVERHREPTLHEHFQVGSGGDWDWMWSETEPARTAAEERLVELDDMADAEAIASLNAVGNPTAESEPGTGRTERWVGVRRDSKRVIAAAALHRSDTGHGVLTGIVVHPEHRGEGLGRAVTASLTRDCVRQDGVATLGMYADNRAARALYAGLDYRVAHAFASRRVEPR